MTLVHFCGYRNCHEIVPLHQRYCDKHKQLDMERWHQSTSNKSRKDYYKDYNKEVRSKDSTDFYNSKAWQVAVNYVKGRDMNMSGVTGKVLMDGDIICDHLVRRDICDDPLEVENLWLLSRREHFWKSKIEKNMLSSPNGKNKLKHISKQWWIDAIKERIDKFGRKN